MAAAVTELARAKVNLTLHVTGRRPDGYHLLDSVVVFAGVADRLTFEVADHCALAVTGPFARNVSSGDDNLVKKAIRALSRVCGDQVTRIGITLEKNLPVAAGLGGGSADAAAALRGLAQFFAIDLPFEKLREIAAGLGADVPVCLGSRAARMSGVGETIEPIADFRPRHAVLVNPGVAVSTAEVFHELKLGTPDTRRDSCRNDLTAPAMRLAPVIGDVLAELEGRKDIERAGMSGSGATCFGLFPSAEAAGKASGAISARYRNWWCRATVLS